MFALVDKRSIVDTRCTPKLHAGEPAKGKQRLAPAAGGALHKGA
jgi:hypothetical protein